MDGMSQEYKGKNAGENQPNAGYRSKPNGTVLKLVGCN